MPGALAVHPTVPVNTVKEFVEWTKTTKEPINFGSAGIGSLSHLGGAMFVSAAEINAVHIPFKLFSDALTEMFSARVHFYVSPIPAVLPHARDGKLRALAVTSAARVSAAQDVPTMAESGLPGFESGTWFALLAPAGAPQEAVARLGDRGADVTITRLPLVIKGVLRPKDAEKAVAAVAKAEAALTAARAAVSSWGRWLPVRPARHRGCRPTARASRHAARASHQTKSSAHWAAPSA